MIQCPAYFDETQMSGESNLPQTGQNVRDALYQGIQKQAQHEEFLQYIITMRIYKSIVFVGLLIFPFPPCTDAAALTPRDLTFTPSPLPESYPVFYPDVRAEGPFQRLDKVDTAFLVLFSIGQLALYPLYSRQLPPPFSSTASPHLRISVFRDNTIPTDPIPPIESQLYGMFYCWDVIIGCVGSPVVATCHFGNLALPAFSEGLLKFEYLDGAGKMANVARDDRSKAVQEAQCRRPTSPAPIENFRRDQRLEPSDSALKVGFSRNRRNAATTPPPIDFSTWPPLSADNDGPSQGSNAPPEIFARIGNFVGAEVDGWVMLGTFMPTIIHLAKTTTPAARLQPMPAQTIIFETIFIQTEYRPRPGAVELPSYELVVKGLVSVARAMKKMGVYRECEFVVFRAGQPILDGSLEVKMESKGVERLIGKQKSG